MLGLLMRTCEDFKNVKSHVCFETLWCTRNISIKLKIFKKRVYKCNLESTFVAPMKSIYMLKIISLTDQALGGIRTQYFRQIFARNVKHRNKYMEGTFLRPHLAHQHKFISKKVGLSKNYIFRTKIFSPKITCKMIYLNIF